jgi:cation:H+ antiporter
LVVSINAAIAQQGDISIGNVVGSNSFNIGIILGLTALLCPIPVHRQIIKIDAPIALGVAFLLLLFLNDKSLTRIEGLILFSGIVVYTIINGTQGSK